MDIEENKKKFNTDGYFKIKNFLDKNEISKILTEIDSSKDMDIYQDKNNVIRRIERIYDKGEFLNQVNDRFINLIKECLDVKVSIFKDKFNLKPPGGEGFYAHYDGIFYFTDSKNEKKKVGMNMEIYL